MQLWLDRQELHDLAVLERLRADGQVHWPCAWLPFAQCSCMPARAAVGVQGTGATPAHVQVLTAQDHSPGSIRRLLLRQAAVGPLRRLQRVAHGSAAAGGALAGCRDPGGTGGQLHLRHCARGFAAGSQERPDSCSRTASMAGRPQHGFGCRGAAAALVADATCSAAGLFHGEESRQARWLSLPRILGQQSLKALETCNFGKCSMLFCCKLLSALQAFQHVTLRPGEPNPEYLASSITSRFCAVHPTARAHLRSRPGENRA